VGRLRGSLAETSGPACRSRAPLSVRSTPTPPAVHLHRAAPTAVGTPFNPPNAPPCPRAHAKRIGHSSAFNLANFDETTWMSAFERAIDVSSPAKKTVL
jgi:hypothetical protein